MIIMTAYAILLVMFLDASIVQDVNHNPNSTFYSVSDRTMAVLPSGRTNFESVLKKKAVELVLIFLRMAK